MHGNQNYKSAFTILLNSIKYLSILVLFSSIFLLVYIPYQETIDATIVDTFKPISDEAIKASKGNFVYENPNKIVDGVHVASGMVYDENFRIVKAVCTRCHSSKLVTQMSATREGWQEMIRWMQKTQGLEQLGEYEPKILDYLSKHYAPKEATRRSNLEIEEIEWYVLELES